MDQSSSGVGPSAGADGPPCTRCGLPVASQAQFCTECGALAPVGSGGSGGRDAAGLASNPGWFSHNEQLGEASPGSGGVQEAPAVPKSALSNTGVPASPPGGAFPPPVSGVGAPAVDPRQPLIDVSQSSAEPAGFSIGGDTAVSPYSDQLPAKPPLRGHRDLVPSGHAVPLGGWNPVGAPIDNVENGDRTWAGYLLVLASTVVALASFFPWAQVVVANQIVTLTGWEDVTGGVSDGPIHLVAGVVGVICGGLAIGGTTGMAVRITAAVAGLVSLASAALRAATFSTALSQLDGVAIGAIAIMWGLWLIVAGALIMTGSALLLSK